MAAARALRLRDSLERIGDRRIVADDGRGAVPRAGFAQIVGWTAVGERPCASRRCSPGASP